MSKQDAVKRYRAAKKALDDNYERELREAKKRGETYIGETPEYRRLNKAVLDAEKNVPWYRR